MIVIPGPGCVLRSPMSLLLRPSLTVIATANTLVMRHRKSRIASSLLFILTLVITMLSCCANCPGKFAQRRSLTRHQGSCLAFQRYIHEQARTRRKRLELQHRMTLAVEGTRDMEAMAIDDTVDAGPTSIDTVPVRVSALQVGIRP